MDKNEFYKELMKQYTLDPEKIRRNAKRASVRDFGSAVRRWIPTAAAAAIVLGIGTAAMLNGLATGGNVELQASGVSAYERVQDAEKDYISVSADEAAGAITAMYVSFAAPLTCGEVQLAFSGVTDTGEIQTERLYFSDGTQLSAAEYTANGAEALAGVKINAPKYLFAAIYDLNVVSLVECASDKINDELFTPVDPAAIEGLTTTTSAEEPVVVVTQTGSETTQPPASTTEPPDTTSEPSDTTEPVETAPELTATQPEETKEPTIGESGITTTPPTTIIDPGMLGENETIPEQLTVLELNLSGVSAVQFICDDCFVAVGTDFISLYRINDAAAVRTVELMTSITASQPKLSGVSSSGSRALITAVGADGRRTKLFIADGSAQTLAELDVSAMTKDTEISFTYVSNNGSKILIKTISLEKTQIYLADMSGAGTLLASFEAPVSLLGYVGNNVYYSSQADGVTSVNRYGIESGKSTQIYSTTDSVRFIRANTFDNFAILNDTNGTAEIFAARSEVISDPIAASNITFSRSNGSIFTDGTNSYTLSVTGSAVLNDPLTAQRYFESSDVSAKYSLYEITSEKIRIQVK